MPTYRDDEQNKLIGDLRAQEEESFTQSTADAVGVPYRDLTGLSINTDALRLIAEETAKKGEMAAYAMVGKKLDIAVKSPTNETAVAELSRLEGLGYETNLAMVSQRSLDKAWSRYADISSSEASRGGLLDISDAAMQEIAAGVHSNDDIKTRLASIFEKKDSHEISEIMETVFGSAIARKSSDVHFEPEETFVRLRLREDGVLQEIIEIDPALYGRLLNRIKFISGMKLSITEKAQDGRFTITYKGVEIEVRVAVAPGAYQESIVLRILNPEGLAVDFEKLGIEPKLFKIFEREIAKPNGMILTTGPTGSGKTTTLYSFLKKIYDPEIKIITIEDPIEYHLPGITQEQVSHEKGFDFLAGLRAALRQDPDVIMVGEIRDNETATIAVNASLTGHMVFSTLHTNNAAGTIPRLLELGIAPGILAAALTVSIAQRLVRKLCPHCKKQTPLGPDKEELLRQIVRHATEVGKDFASYGITADMPMVAYAPVGCAECDQTGFKGRVGLYEAILTDDAIAQTMVKVPPPSEREIKRVAERQGILTMIEDGVIKILTGVTSFDEIQSVVDLSEDVGSGAVSSPLQGEVARGPASDGGVGTAQETPSPRRASALPLSKGEKPQPTEPRYVPESSAGEELALLVDYLKLLESSSDPKPEKIERAKHMIISMLERAPDLRDLFASDSPRAAVKSEIESLVDDLHILQADQEKNPSMDVAQKLAAIRSTIETMAREVVK